MKEDVVISLIRSGNRSGAFEKVYEYFPMIRKMILTAGGNEDDARDMFQDSVIVFYRQALKEDFILSSSVSTFIYSIARNLWLKKLRDYHSHYKPVADISEPSEIMDDPEEEEFDAVKTAEEVLNLLGEPCSKLLSLFYYEKKSMVEIAQMLDYSGDKTAKAQKYKCIERAKKMLGDKLEHLKKIFA